MKVPVADDKEEEEELNADTSNMPALSVEIGGSADVEEEDELEDELGGELL